MKINDNGIERNATAEEEAEILAIQASMIPLVPTATTYKADIWRRATDAEADTIVFVLSQQTTRKQRLFNDATVLDHSDPQFTEVLGGFTAAFGEARALELLAPSE